MNKPVVLSDLDDTLFQTRRKMVDELAPEPFRTGAVDRTLNPRSFMTEEQSMLVDWLRSRLNSYPLPHGELKKSAAYGSLSTLGQSPLTGPSFSRQKANPTRSGRPICSASWLLSGKADIDAASDH